MHVSFPHLLNSHIAAAFGWRPLLEILGQMYKWFNARDQRGDTAQAMKFWGLPGQSQ